MIRIIEFCSIREVIFSKRDKLVYGTSIVFENSWQVCNNKWRKSLSIAARTINGHSSAITNDFVQMIFDQHPGWYRSINSKDWSTFSSSSSPLSSRSTMTISDASKFIVIRSRSSALLFTKGHTTMILDSGIWAVLLYSWLFFSLQMTSPSSLVDVVRSKGQHPIAHLLDMGPLFSTSLSPHV